MTQLLENSLVAGGPPFRSIGLPDQAGLNRAAFHRVALYSPHPLLLAGLRAELAEFSGFKVVVETGSPAELLEFVSRTPVSLLIFDPARPGETLRLVRAIQQRVRRPLPMIVLNGETKGQAAQLKAMGAILADKVIDSSYFMSLVELAVHGRQPLPGIRFYARPEPLPTDGFSRPELTIKPAQPAKPAPVVAEPEGKLPLSPRELQILGIIGQGRTNREVAQTLCISCHTLKNHLNNIFKKLAVEDRTQALMFCVRRGWVSL
jgi:DNA-binding NarL/FixJ family response regulator